MPSLPARIKKISPFEIILYMFLFFCAFVFFFPFWTTLVGSLNDGLDYLKGGVYLYPRKFTFLSYIKVLSNKAVLNSYKVTILRTLIGTFTHVVCSSMFAYAYSRKILRGKKFYTFFCLFTMYLSGGLIPTYILYKYLHLLDNFLVFIIPGIVGFWDVIIIQTFFKDNSIESITECAMVDGANEYTICFKIVIPLAVPVLAAIVLFSGVGHWNSYSDVVFFTTKKSLQTAQVLLMTIVRDQQRAAEMANLNIRQLLSKRAINAQTVTLATMMVATMPIVCIYPLLQRYFIKGIMVGSLKG